LLRLIMNEKGDRGSKGEHESGDLTKRDSPCSGRKAAIGIVNCALPRNNDGCRKERK
jgi:hypothetical protein